MFETVEASVAAVTRRPPPVRRRAHGRVGPDRDARPGRRRVWESLAAEEPAGYDTTPAGTGACSAATGPDADHAAGTGGAAGVPVSERGRRAAECAARCASTPGSVLGHAVGVLAAALDALAGADVDDEHPAVAGDALVALHGLAARLHAVVLSTLDSFDRRQGWAADGAVTASSWLAARTGTDHTAAHHLVHCARRLRALPRLAAHLAAGDITPAHAAAVTRAATPHRAQAIADAEGILADLALTNPPRDLRHALRRLADAADPDGSDPPDEQPGGDPLRELRLRQGYAGRGELTATLDPLTREALNVLLDAFATPDPPDTPDEQQRTPTQRRHDAFSAMLHTLLAQPGLPTVQGSRPHILLTIDLAALLGLPCDHPVAGTTLTDLAERLGFDLASHGLTLGVSTDSDSADATQTDYGAPADHGAPAGTGDNARDDVSSPVQQRARSAGPQANPNDMPQPPPPSVDSPRAGPAPDSPGAGTAPDSPGAGTAPDPSRAGPAPDPAATPPPRRPARFGSGQPANPALVRGLLPAATIMAVLTLGPWRAVNVGSVHRTLPAWLRTVLLAMHQHCRGPDCDRPATWTQAHHITPWATSRTTDLNDTLPLCAAHHKLIDKGWTATLDHATGNATWTAPTGRTIIVPPP